MPEWHCASPGPACSEASASALLPDACKRGRIELAGSCRRSRSARIPFRGTVEGENTDILAAIGSVFRNAFAGAFVRSIDDSISLKDVEVANGEG